MPVQEIQIECPVCGKVKVVQRKTVLRAQRLRRKLFCSSQCAGKYGAQKRWQERPQSS